MPPAAIQYDKSHSCQRTIKMGAGDQDQRVEFAHQKHDHSQCQLPIDTNNIYPARHNRKQQPTTRDKTKLNCKLFAKYGHFKRTRHKKRSVIFLKQDDDEVKVPIKRIISSSSRQADRCYNSNYLEKVTVKESLPSKQALKSATIATRWAVLSACAIAALVSYQTTTHAVPQAADTIGVQQAMAQMLQVFNGNDSSQLEANHFKVFKLFDDSALVGARNFVYNLSLTTMREQRRIEWPSTPDDINMCRLKGKTAEQCQNYIKVVEMDSPSSLIVCGTNAYKPRCRNYRIEPNAYALVNEYAGEGACPYQETQNVTSLIADGQLYSATTAQFSGVDALIHRAHTRTEQFNPKQLNSPNFVGSFRYGDHVYFLFKEIAIEHINCGKTIYSRIARVCISDTGGPTRVARERFTSFVKARLNCSLPGEFPFAFDEIQSASGVVSSAYHGAAPLSPNQQQTPTISVHDQGQDMFYAVFTTPQNSIGGSAICAYRMADVLAAFDGPFKAQTDGMHSQWLPLSETRVPRQPVRPGQCVNDSRRLPDNFVSFMRDNPLMDKAVEPIWSQPLITMASINFRFTQIAVDTQVETRQAPGSSAMRTDVIFVATDDGRVFKLINTYHLYASSFVHQVLASSSSIGGYPTATAASLHPEQKMSPQPALSGAPARLAAGVQLQQQQQPPQQQQREPVVDVTANTVVVEELHLFDSKTPVLGLLLYSGGGGLGGQQHSGKLIVASFRQIKAVPLSRCERATSCAQCLALFDPYCAWDIKARACLDLGRSMAPNNKRDLGWLHSTADENEIMRQLIGGTRDGISSLPSAAKIISSWYPANNAPAQMNNHTLAWWSSSCPAPAPGELMAPPPNRPIKSIFSSHVQVPSRYDYASGHHLSRASTIMLPNGIGMMQPITRQPVSECLTFCGVDSSFVPISLGASDQQQQQHQLTGMIPSECVDYLAQQSSFVMQQQQQQANGNSQFVASPLPGQNANSLYPTVIICIICALLVGLLLGFVFGKRSVARSLCGSTLPGSAIPTSKHHDSSICSSTFDETNLYMASTGSHQAAALAALHQQQAPIASQSHLFAAQHMRHQQPHHHYQATSSHQQPRNSFGVQLHQQQQQQQQQQLEAAQSLVANNQSECQTTNPGQQLFLQLAANEQRQKAINTGPIRTGALPPLPHNGQQPLVNQSNGPTTHINHSQLTPPTSSSGSSSTNGSSTATQIMQAAEQQVYLNEQQLLMATAASAQSNGAGQQAKFHQRSFNGISHHSDNLQQSQLSTTKHSANNNGGNTNFQQLANSKIYL